MATNPERLPYESRVDDLLKTYRAAQRTIANEVRAAITAGDLQSLERRAAQLQTVLDVLDELGAQTDPDARKLVADAFAESAAATQQAIIGLRIDAPEIPGAFAGVQRDAVQALQDSMLGRLDASRQTVGRTVDDVYARAGRRAAMRAVLGADGSPRAARRQLVADLLKDRQVQRLIADGGTGFVDVAGRQWGLQTYAEMVVRTTTREAVVQGAIARMTSHGVNLARISVSPKPCAVCLPWQGRLVSLDGSTQDYEGEAVTDLGSLPNGGPPLHPRCTHTVQPVAVRIEAIRRELAGQRGA